MADTTFVTGASGQLGRPLVAALVARGDRVIAQVRRKESEAEVAALGATVLVGSLDDRGMLDEGVAEATRIFHLAGGIRREGALDADRINHLGTNTLCEAARARKGKLASVVYASTAAVYGDRQGLWVAEDYAPSPNSDYGRAKVAAEAVLLRACREEKLPVRVARIGPVYGHGFRFLMDGPIKAGRAWLPGEGLNYVSVIHVDDCVRALLAVDERGQNGELYHVAAPNPPLMKDFYAEVHKRVGGKPVRFWSTWVPSVFQFQAARLNERVMIGLGRKPRFTQDNLRIIPSGVRLRVERLEKELAFTWTWPDYKLALDALFPRGA